MLRQLTTGNCQNNFAINSLPYTGLRLSELLFVLVRHQSFMFLVLLFIIRKCLLCPGRARTTGLGFSSTIDVGCSIPKYNLPTH